MLLCSALIRLLFFFFNDTAPTEIYTLSLHDALPISGRARLLGVADPRRAACRRRRRGRLGLAAADHERDRKSTRLNSSHTVISYAVFCLKKKKIHQLAGAQKSEQGAEHIIQRQLRD